MSRKDLNSITISYRNYSEKPWMQLMDVGPFTAVELYDHCTPQVIQRDE